jgi:hypothetical protein
MTISMVPIPLRSTIDAVLDAYSETLDGIESIAIGGSVGRGIVDEYSDLEIYIYLASRLPSETSIRKILNRLDATPFRSNNLLWQHPAWGTHTFFRTRGVKIELGYRRTGEIEDSVRRFLSGEFRSQHGIHDTPFGHYVSGLASCLVECSLVRDGGFISRMRDLLVPMPFNLKVELIRHYFDDARIVTHEKLRVAAKRNDAYHFNACLSFIIRGLTIALFAVNDTYYPGDKWNGLYVDRFLLKPERYNSTIGFLFDSPNHGRANKQRKVGLIELLVDAFEQMLSDQHVMECRSNMSISASE